MADSNELKDHYTVKVEGGLVEQAHEEFEGETTIRGLVRQSMERGLDRNGYVRSLENLTLVLAVTNYYLVRKLEYGSEE